jgi:hypothetical protein
MKNKLLLIIIFLILTIRPAFAGGYFGYDVGSIETDVNGKSGEEFGADNFEGTIGFGLAFGENVKIKIGSDVDLNFGSHQGGYRRGNSAGQSQITTIVPALFTVRPKIGVSAHLGFFVMGFSAGVPYTSFTAYGNDVRVDSWRGNGRLSTEYFFGIGGIRSGEILFLFRQEKYPAVFRAEEFDIENKKISLAFTRNF